MLPWEFAELGTRRKAALIGMIRVRLEAEKQARLQSSRSGKRR
ncbi:hypothetical protein ACTHPH_07395 [Paenibacillus pasadenensis]|uniref:Uncharacterized protein n=1 Tax=Paenibacillus pasadenensis TaxID=217090 RepID=A0A2N5N9T0_9BACL|nr:MULTISPECIES: hypothetical protein [Paenibacillus]PLT47075.1 hypothetical protein B8V81_1299 [Paenibacillus pasadenensis]